MVSLLLFSSEPMIRLHLGGWSTGKQTSLSHGAQPPGRVDGVSLHGAAFPEQLGVTMLHFQPWKGVDMTCTVKYET